MIQDLVRKSRSFRRFDQDYEMSLDILIKLVNNARFCPSAANLQPLRYIIVNDRELNEKIFACTKWAAYLENWQGPEEGERPTAYIVIIGDVDHPARHQIDTGIAAQTIMLSATELGFGGCMLAALDKDKLRELLDISGQYEILLALALGKPNEKVTVVNVNQTGDIRYRRNERDVHVVPKRKLDDIIYKIWTASTSSR